MIKKIISILLCQVILISIMSTTVSATSYGTIEQDESPLYLMEGESKTFSGYITTSGTSQTLSWYIGSRYLAMGDSRITYTAQISDSGNLLKYGYYNYTYGIVSQYKNSVLIYVFSSTAPTKPVITSSTSVSDEWSDVPVELIFESTMSGYGEIGYQYRIGETGEWIDLDGDEYTHDTPTSIDGVVLYARAYNKDLDANSYETLYSEVSEPFIIKYDKSAPVIYNITTTPVGYSSEKTITVTASDLGTGVTGYYFSDSSNTPSVNASSWQTTNAKTVSENGNYYIWAKDAAGNISSMASVAVSGIDNSPPTINVTVTTGTANSHTITVVASDQADGSGVSGYYFSDSPYTPDVDASGWQTANTKTVSENSYYYIWAKDAAGNISSMASVNVSGIVQKVTSAYMANKTVKVNSTVDANLIYYGIPKSITYTSSDDLIATVDNTGVITGVNFGEVIITATLENYNNTVVVANMTVAVDTADLIDFSDNSEDDITGYIFGESRYINADGVNKSYEGTSVVDGVTYNGYEVNFTVNPTNNYVKAYVDIMDTKFPVTFTNDTQTNVSIATTQSVAKSILDFSMIDNSKTNTLLTIYAMAYKDATCTELVDSDSYSMTVSVDKSPPVFAYSFNDYTGKLTISVKDIIAGIDSISYLIKNDDEIITNTSSDEKFVVEINKQSIVTVTAVDNVGNVKVSSTSELTPYDSSSVSGDDDNVVKAMYYKTYLFDCYVVNGTRNNEFYKIG